MEIYSVLQVTRRLKDLIESNEIFQDVWISGEVSNFVLHQQSGHAYFSMRDGAATIRCVLFRRSISQRTLLPQNGTSVIAHGRISIYEPQGAYQLYVDLVQPEGVGLLHLQLEELRTRLEREGLFDPTRKRPLPRFPRTIGVVTSPTGAVIRDIITIVSRRYPLVEIVIVPTSVQGDDAPPQIAEAIEILNATIEPDVIIVARGGGSIEDLWAFNDERVARAIYGSHAPVVSAVGHETDVTIADWVADVRAPTPSAAAELVVPDRDDVAATISVQTQRLNGAMQTHIDELRRDLDRLLDRLDRHSPLAVVERHRQTLDDLTARAAVSMQHRIEVARARATSLERQTAALSPLAVLRRGYAVCQSPSGELIRSVNQVNVGDAMVVRVSDGTIAGTAGRTQKRVESRDPQR